MSPLQVAGLMAAAPAGSRFSAGFDTMVMKLCQAGPERLMVITDFDQTLLGQFNMIQPNHTKPPFANKRSCKTNSGLSGLHDGL